MRWTGRILSAIPVLMLVMSAVMKLTSAKGAVDGFVGTFGYPAAALVPIGIVELTVAILYAVPQTAVLGAILVTGYLGGATATHVRVGDVFYAPIVLGVLAWVGLWLRDEHLRRIAPLRRLGGESA